MQLKKRGYFFILDAMLALFIIILGVFIITSSRVEVPQVVQVSLLSDDLLNFLSGKKIRDLNNPYAGIGGELWKIGEITSAENTLLQQIAEFYVKNKNNIAEKFVQNVSKEVIPSQFIYELWLDNVRIYPQTATAAHTKSRQNTQLLLTSKRITFGILNETTGELFGPYKAEVYVWER